jgi:hypothetical protein
MMSAIGVPVVLPSKVPDKILTKSSSSKLKNRTMKLDKTNKEK